MNGAGPALHDRAPASGADPRAQRRAERRRQLLDAAVHAIRTLGPAATMEQIARAGGVTKPILYRHFGDRDGLIDAVADRFAADLLTSVTTPLVTDLSALELLRSTVDSYVGFIERETNLYRFMVQHPPERGDGANGMRSLIDRVAQQVALVAAARLRLAGRDDRPAEAWAFGIVGLVHQAGDWWVDDQTITREALVTDLVALLWGGLAGAAATEGTGT